MKKQAKKSSVEFRCRRSVAVRPHASGAWTAVIGKQLNDAKTALKPKQFYFHGTEIAAQTEAERMLTKWHFVFKHWKSQFQPLLKTIGSPFSNEPHWDAALGQKRHEPTAEAIEAFQNRPPTSEEIAEAYENVSLQSVVGLYRLQRDTEVAQGDVRQTTVTAEFKNIRNAIKHFPNGLPMDNLTLAIITDAKAKLLRAVGRRTAKNYLAAMKAMLKWFYDGSDYGKQHDKPTNFDRIFGVSGAVRTDIKTATSATLKKLLEISSDRQRLYIMLALNCGMYQADIGYLQPSEIDIDGGYAFWDRSKEPQNPFKVRHDLWAETLQLVKRFYQHDGEFAFVSDDGLPLYDVKDAKEGGNTYDRVGQTYTPLRRAMPTAPQFHELRKSTNQALTDLLHRQAEPMAIAEISKEFLGQKTPTLARVYATSGLHSYDRMNRYLKAVGKKFRADGVFDALKGQ